MPRYGLIGLVLRALLATTVALLALGPSFVAAQNADPFGRAISIQERITPQLMEKAGVVGTGVGRNAAGVPVIRVYTVDESVAGLPRSAEGVGVRSVVTGLITAQACQDTGDPTERCNRPVPIGVSVGHPQVTAGTIGARVSRNGNVYVLSNNHVIANSNNANVGDPTLQPGAFDGGSDPGDEIGTLAEWKTINFNYTSCTSPFSPTNPACNTIDAAIALSSTTNLGTATLAGWTPSATTQADTVGLSVLKCGRTTGCTTGSIAEVNVVVDVCYASNRFFCTSAARFVDQFTVSPGTFSDGGDSGSLIVTNDSNKKPTGLLFAGSDTRTIANPIGYVLTHFGVSVDSSSTSPEPDVTPPAAPTGLTAKASDSQVSLSWNANSETDLAGYNVYRSTTSGSGYTKVNGSLVTGTSFNNTGLTNGTTYYYVVTAVDSSANQSPHSNQASATPEAATAPAGPADLTAAKRIQGTVRIDLRWTGGGSSIDVFRQAPTATSFTRVATVSNTGAYTDNLGKRPTAGTYHYLVCNASTSACSNEVEIGAP